MIRRNTCSIDGCNYPVWAKKLCKGHQSLRTDKKDNPIRKTAISNISQKELKRLAKYRPIRDKFLRENPECMVPGCCGKSTNHHAKGRIGDLLWDVKFFRNLCWPHHQQAENNPEWAYENGYSLRRNENDQ